MMKLEVLDSRRETVNMPPDLEDMSDWWIAWVITEWPEAAVRSTKWPAVFTKKGLFSEVSRASRNNTSSFAITSFPVWNGLC